MGKQRAGLRVALLAGSLGQGGAEKQLVYMAWSLRQAGVDVRVYSLTRGEFYESALQAMGLEPVWVGRFGNPLLRLVTLMGSLQQFKPHVLQSTHFFPNLYISIIGRLRGMVAIGSIRNDTLFELNANRRWGRWLLHMPPALLTNSYSAKRNAEARGVRAEAISVVPNVIDLPNFDLQMSQGDHAIPEMRRPVVITVGSLLDYKRQDRFLAALARAREEVSDLKGVLAGDGRDQGKLASLAGDLGLLPDGLRFMGRRNDVPALLSQASMFALTSDHEGFPNVLLEAMAAGLPVITTPAGDAGAVVQDGVTGYVVPFDDIDGMARLMIRLAQSPDLSRQLGNAGRRRAEQCYSHQGLGDRLVATYYGIAQQQNNRRLLHALKSRVASSE